MDDLYLRGLSPEIKGLRWSDLHRGSVHESDVPLVIYNYKGKLPVSGRFGRNADLAHFLFC